MKFLTFKKYRNWEYWPSFMFYIPLLPYGCYLALKSRSFGFFSAVNPGIEESGNGLESKFKTLQLIPEKYRPKSIFVPTEEKIQTTLQKLSRSEISFPLIIKPDIGFRGLLVKKIDTEHELFNYLKRFRSLNLIIQEYITLKNECSIFYYRNPDEKMGSITSFTLKKYLSVTGNGKSTLLALIRKDERAKKYEDLVSEINKIDLYTIPSMNEKIILNVIGNHSKGTQFINGNNLINNELTLFLDILSKRIDGWYFGRIDVKYNSFNELQKGEHLKILELNGIISEPTHIYDASNGTYLKAIRSLKKHWRILFTIGVKNHHLKNSHYTDLPYLLNLYFRYKKYVRKISKLSRTNKF